ncbi:YopX family protein [Jeotgalibaca porci]|uniref:YopX family protein n=1 Tax=Jeotgalibaca porci TaxID=1868793 RepID=UPI0035A08649
MNDIKFRAWDKKKNDWFDDDWGDLCIELNGNIYFAWNGEIMDDYTDRIILLQYTGMKDIKGVEIYEGDILQSEHYFRYQVVFKGDCWRCESLKNNRFKNRFIGRDLKVIGNIYQNKDLLED